MIYKLSPLDIALLKVCLSAQRLRMLSESYKSGFAHIKDFDAEVYLQDSANHCEGLLAVLGNPEITQFDK